jgi:hypothetical protein
MIVRISNRPGSFSGYQRDCAAGRVLAKLRLFPRWVKRRPKAVLPDLPQIARRQTSILSPVLRRLVAPEMPSLPCSSEACSQLTAGLSQTSGGPGSKASALRPVSTIAPRRGSAIPTSVDILQVALLKSPSETHIHSSRIRLTASKLCVPKPPHSGSPHQNSQFWFA